MIDTVRNTMQENTMQVRKSKDRGHVSLDWLDSHHSFSFGHYYDVNHMGYSVLRVINEDIVAPAQGFGMHAHRDMEIITYMLGGALQHKDSMGNGSIIKAGDVQRMTAGTGVKHSEFNASATDSAHLLQIWLLPEANDITPGYEEKNFDEKSKTEQWRLIASRQARENSLLIHQDVDLYATILPAARTLTFNARMGRNLYLQIARGTVMINQLALSQGDALMVEVNTQNVEPTIEILSQSDAEILLFDLPSTH